MQSSFLALNVHFAFFFLCFYDENSNLRQSIDALKLSLACIFIEFFCYIAVVDLSLSGPPYNSN
jgi:hypothetical protein